MKKIALIAILSSLSLISKATEVVFIKPENTINPSEAEKAFALLISKGLITKDVSTGKYVVESSNVSSVPTTDNIQTIDMDALESEMKAAHPTDF